MPRDFQKIRAWERGHQMTLDVYRMTRYYPREELFGLTSQMRRAAASIPTNIAEGCGRRSEADLARFMDMSRGSASELTYQMILSRDLEYLAHDVAEKVMVELDEIGRMITSYSRQLRS